MVTAIKLTCRTATVADRQRLANLIHFEPLVHRHLDWRAPLDWIGKSPYLLAERGSRLEGALACPPDPDEVAWLRLFATAGENSPAETWWSLWPEAQAQLRRLQTPYAAAMPMLDWFRKLLQINEFELTHRVIMMQWERGDFPAPRPTEAAIRPMNLNDLPAIEVVDRKAFHPLWRNSPEALQIAFRQAAVASVAEIDGQLVGYQISTGDHMGGHLARLATHPQFQGRGVGHALLRDTLVQFSRRGTRQITVNTQHDNYASIILYEKAGFQRTGETYPVYQYQLA